MTMMSSSRRNALAVEVLDAWLNEGNRSMSKPKSTRPTKTAAENWPEVYLPKKKANAKAVPRDETIDTREMADWRRKARRREKLQAAGMVDVTAIEKAIQSSDAINQIERKMLAETALRQLINRVTPTFTGDPGLVVTYNPLDGPPLTPQPARAQPRQPPRQPPPLVRGRKVYAIKGKSS